MLTGGAGAASPRLQLGRMQAGTRSCAREECAEERRQPKLVLACTLPVRHPVALLANVRTVAKMLAR